MPINYEHVISPWPEGMTVKELREIVSEHRRRKPVYHSEISRRIAEKLEADGIECVYLEELRKGKSSITDIWVETRREIEQMQDSQPQEK